METSAKFSPNREYRYSLTRIWDDSKPLVTFCMLNPSTADEFKNDPTVERCQRRAKLLGFGGMIVVNIFAYRSTDPQELYKSTHVIELSPFENDHAIMDAAYQSDLFICGWGKHGNLFSRGFEVQHMLERNGFEPQALKINKDGTPAHPLYISYGVLPFRLKTLRSAK